MTDEMDFDKLAPLEKAAAVMRAAMVGLEETAYAYGVARGRRARDAELRERLPKVFAPAGMEADMQMRVNDALDLAEPYFLALLTDPTLPTGGTDG